MRFHTTPHIIRILLPALLAPLLLGGCGTTERVTTQNVAGGATYEASSHGITKERAVLSALTQAVTEAAPIEAETETVTLDGQFKSRSRGIHTTAYLVDYRLLDHSSGVTGHEAVVEATFTFSEKLSLAEATRRAERMSARLGRTKDEQPVEIGRAVEHLQDYQERNRGRMQSQFDDEFHPFTASDVSHMRRIRFQYFVPIEARIYADPRGFSGLFSLGAVAEVANDLNSRHKDDYEDAVGHDSWHVDTTFMGIVPWTRSPSQEWIVAAEIGQANYYTVSSGDEEEGEVAPTLEEIDLPEESGASPYVGVSIEHLRPSGWGVHYTGRYIHWRDGAPDIYQRMVVFREWYEPWWVSVGDIRAGFGYISTDGGLLDDYHSLSLQVGWVF